MTINEAWNKAEKRLYELYGDDLDINILSRYYPKQYEVIENENIWEGGENNG